MGGRSEGGTAPTQRLALELKRPAPVQPRRASFAAHEMSPCLSVLGAASGGRTYMQMANAITATPSLSAGMLRST